MAKHTLPSSGMRQQHGIEEVNLNSCKLTRDHFKGTKLCTFYAQGCCTRGADCTFAHGGEKLQQLPDLYKTRVCLNFSGGYCKAGAECIFAHGLDELRTPYKETAATSSLAIESLDDFEFSFDDVIPQDNLIVGQQDGLIHDSIPQGFVSKPASGYPKAPVYIPEPDPNHAELLQIKLQQIADLHAVAMYHEQAATKARESLQILRKSLNELPVQMPRQMTTTSCKSTIDDDADVRTMPEMMSRLNTSVSSEKRDLFESFDGFSSKTALFFVV